MTERSRWRRAPRIVRVGLLIAGGVVGLIVIAVCLIVLTFDPNSMKPRIIEAVKHETGRDLSLNGPISLAFAVRPTVTAKDVAFANPPGFDRPQMATLAQLNLQLALLPLLSGRVEIERLDLLRPDIVLEVDAQGRPNWQMAPERTATANNPPTGSASQAAAKSPHPISIAEFDITDGKLTWKGANSQQAMTVDIKSLRASAASPDSPLRIDAVIEGFGESVALHGEFGPLSRLLSPDADAPWPVQLTATAAGAKLSVDGTLTRPLEGRGYNLKISATAPDSGSLARHMPDRRLPTLQDLAASAQIADTGGALPSISALTLHAGSADLNAYAPGLRLTRLDASAATFDQPFKFSVAGSLGDQPLTATGSAGTPATLLASVQGQPLAVEATLTSPQGDIAGNATLHLGARPSLQADLKSNKLDVDAFRAAFGNVDRAAGTSPAVAPAPAQTPAQPAKATRALADAPLSFDGLAAADADVTLSINELKAGGQVYRAVTTHATLQGGKLHVAPLTADSPEGHVTAALDIDTTQAPVALALQLTAPAVALQPLLVALQQPPYASGNLEVYADLRGAGATLRQVGATLDGTLGLAMVNGSLDNRLLGSSLGSLLREVNLLDLVGRGGSSQVQCFATRLDLQNGIGRFRTLVLASSLLSADGGGSLNLGNETLDLRVRSAGRVAGTAVVVPLIIAGPFKNPTVKPDPTATLADNAGTVAGVIAGASPLGIIAGAVAGPKLLGQAPAPNCGRALSIARGGQAAVPVEQEARQPAAPAPATTPKLPNIGGVLQKLLR